MTKKKILLGAIVFTGIALGTWLICSIPSGHTAAADAPPVTTFNFPGGVVTVIEDTSRGNACYIVQPGGAISCAWMHGYGR